MLKTGRSIKTLYNLQVDLYSRSKTIQDETKQQAKSWSLSKVKNTISHVQNRNIQFTNVLSYQLTTDLYQSQFSLESESRVPVNQLHAI